MQTTLVINCLFLVGPTLKIRRHVVHKKYGATIEGMYSESRTPHQVRIGSFSISLANTVCYLHLLLAIYSKYSHIK